MSQPKTPIAVGCIVAAALFAWLLIDETPQPSEVSTSAAGTEKTPRLEIHIPERATPHRPTASPDAKHVSQPSCKCSDCKDTEIKTPQVKAWPAELVQTLESVYPDYHKGIKHVVRSVEAETYMKLPADDAKTLIKYAQVLQSRQSPQPDTSRRILHLCWSTDTLPQVEEAFEAVRALAIVESESAALTETPQVSEDDAPVAQPVFQGDDRWTFTATDGSTGSEGTPVTLTWSFVPDNTMINNNRGSTLPSNLIATLNSTYGSPTTPGDYTTAPWFSMFTDMFDYWAAITGNIYVYEPNDDGGTFPVSRVTSGLSGSLGVRGDVRLSGVSIDGNSDTLAFNFYPNVGDMVIDTNDTSNFTNNATTRARFVNMLCHEHGHGLGLGHVCPINSTKLMEPFVSTAFAGPQLDDMLTIQEIYGDSFERNGGNKNNDTIATAYNFGTLNSSAAATNVTIGSSSDVDIYRFQISSARELNVTATPTDELPYLEGVQNSNGTCTTGTSFDPRNRQNLIIRVIDTDGTTVLGSSNAAAIGQAETLSSIQLLQTGQDYYVEITGGGENGGDANNAQLYTLDLELVDPSAVQLGNFTITSENFTPANGAPDPGETITASVEVSNIGVATATDIDVTLSGSANLNVISSVTQNIASLTPGSSTTLSYTFILSGDCGDNETIKFRADTSTGFVELNTELMLGAIGVASVENFDSTSVGQVPSGFTASATLSSMAWSVTSAHANSPSNSIGSTRTSGFSSESAFLEYLITETVSGNLELQFAHRYVSAATAESDGSSERLNGGVLEIQIDGGPWTDWEDAGGTFSQNGYNSSIKNVVGFSPLAGRDAWTGNSGGFITTKANFPVAAYGAVVRVRWHHGTVSAYQSGGGWWIDDVTLNGPVCSTTMLPTLSVSAPSPTLEEFTPSTTSDFVVSATMAVTSDLLVAYTLSGDAVSGSDFVALAGTATITSGQDDVAIPVTAITDTEVEGDETLTLTLTPSANYAITTAAASITIKDLPFDNFRYENFGAAVTNVGPGEDFDFDGISNLIEYAFRLDPTVPGPLPFSVLVNNSGGAKLELAYYEDTQLNDVSYIVETSSTLETNSWTTTGVTITNGATTNGLQARTASINVSNGQPGFLRVRVERVTP